MQQNDIMPIIFEQIRRAENVGGLNDIKESFQEFDLLSTSGGGENTVQSFLIARQNYEFVFKSIRFHCRALWSDIVKLARNNEHSNKILIGESQVFQTTWARTIMTEKQINPVVEGRTRASQIYNALRSCGFVNMISNMITSYALIMEDQQELLHYTKVPIQFVEIANQYLLNYTVKLHIGSREVSKPQYMKAEIQVYVPNGIRDAKMSLMRTLFGPHADDQDIVHSQFERHPVEFPKQVTKEWYLKIDNCFCYPGYGLLLMVPFHRKWNVDCFTLLLKENDGRIPLFPKRLSSSPNCIWFLLSIDEKTTIFDLVDPKKAPENLESMLDFSRIEDSVLLMTNSKHEELRLPDDDENSSCLMWHHFNIYRNCSGVAGNTMA